MSAIATVNPKEAEGTVKEVYDRMKEAWGMVSPAFAVMSLHPDYLEAMWNIHQAVMKPGRLSGAEKETLALAVSAVNGCRFCIWAHAGRLRSLGVDEERVEALREDPRSAPLDERTRALVAWAVKATREPAALSGADLDRLREAGWEDADLLEASAVVGHLNHLNRTLDAFGVEAPEKRPSDRQPSGPTPS